MSFSGLQCDLGWVSPNLALFAKEPKRPLVSIFLNGIHEYKLVCVLSVENVLELAKTSPT